MSQASTTLRRWGTFKHFAPTDGHCNGKDKCASPHSCYKLQSEKTTTTSRHLPGRNPPSELWCLAQPQTDLSALMWSGDIELHFAPILKQEELLVPGRFCWAAAPVWIHSDKGEQVPKGWRQPGQQCVKEAAPVALRKTPHPHWPRAQQFTSQFL